MLIVIGAILFFIIGLVLSLIGSGGAILSIPVLVYIFDIIPYLATALPIFIMDISNWAATTDNIKRKTVLYKIGLCFAIPGLLVTFAIRRFIMPVNPPVIFENNSISISKGNGLMLVFAILIFVAALRTDRKS